MLFRQSWTPKPNTFLATVSGPGFGQNKFLAMCYPTKNPGGSIPAAGNFWGTEDFGGNIVPLADPTPGFDVRRSAGTTCSALNPLIPVVWTPAVSAEPRECAPQFTCDPPQAGCWSDCILLTDAETSVRSQFLAGYERIMTEEPGEAYNEFVPVADLWQAELPTGYTDQCRTFIHAARSLTEGDYSGGERQFANRAPGEPVIKIQPNPASGETTVLLPEGPCHVSVYDQTGRLKYTAQAENVCRLETAAWPQGLYIVEVKGNKTAFSRRAKLIVQN